MMPARKGDGTGLSFPGIAEMRKGDGTVLWSSEPDIPDSGVYWMRGSGWGSSTQNTQRTIASNTYDAVGVLVNITTFWSSGLQLYWQDGSTVGPRVRIVGGGAIDFFNGSTWQSTGISITAGSSYQVRISSIDYGASTATLEVLDDTGSTVGSSGIDFQSSISSINTIKVGGFDANEFFVDNWYADGSIVDSFEDNDMSDWSQSGTYFEVVQT